MYSLMYFAVLCITIFVCVFMVAGIVCGCWLMFVVVGCCWLVGGKMAMSKKG
jgi:hypothetical protein